MQSENRVVVIAGDASGIGRGNVANFPGGCETVRVNGDMRMQP